MEIIDHAPFGPDLPAEIPAGAAIVVDEGFQLHAEAAGVAQDKAMRGGYARCAGVEIKFPVKGRDLVRPAGLHDPVSAANRPHAPSDAIASLKHFDLIPRLLQLVGSNEAGNPSAQDDDRLAIAACLRELEIRGTGRRRGDQAKRFHSQEDGARSPDCPQLCE